jgi:hypothetical protein
VAARSRTAEVIVVGREGAPVLRFRVEGGGHSFERLADPELSLCYQRERGNARRATTRPATESKSSRSRRTSCRSGSEAASK